MKLLGHNRVLAAIVTPQDEEGSIHLERLYRHANWLLANGCDGIALFGTTGEASSFSVPERIRALTGLIDMGLAPSRLLVGTGCCAVSDAIELSGHATQCEVAGVLMIPPFFFKSIRDAALQEFYARVIEGVDRDNLQIVLYHFPDMAGVGLSHELVHSLYKEYPQTIVGIKDSTGNLTSMLSLVQQLPGFLIFTGDDDLLGPILLAGGAGSITAGANIFPNLLSVVRTDPELTLRSTQATQAQIKTLWSDCLLKLPVTEAIKEILASATGDASWLGMRPPLAPIDAQQKAFLFEKITEVGFSIAEDLVAELKSGN